MHSKARITSIIKANSLDSSVTGISSFNLPKLYQETDLDFPLPTNVRLGHLAEKVVSELIKSSAQFDLLYENIQVLEDKKTIGEIDFIVEDNLRHQIIHMELAYKFYLFDPKISVDHINNWIGPNRNDSLAEKLSKLKIKQFPLLYHPCTKSALKTINIDEVQQALCLLVSLYIPYQFKEKFDPVYEEAIKGYYLNFEQFMSLDNSEKTYYLPHKKEWGIDPSENQIWTDYSYVVETIKTSMNEHQAPLCWQKKDEVYEAFFIIWW
jgi:hypothetical protein